MRAREDDATAVEEGAIAETRELALAIVVDTVTCRSGAAHDADVTASRGACTTAILETDATARANDGRECDSMALAEPCAP